jgi:hypothetical protein
MSAAIDKDLLDTCVGEKLEGIFDERRVGEGQQTLNNRQSDNRQAWRSKMCRHTLGRSSVNGLKRVSKGSARIYTVSLCKSMCGATHTTACSGSSRSSSPDLPLSWPFFPLGGMLALCDVFARGVVAAGQVSGKVGVTPRGLSILSRDSFLAQNTRVRRPDADSYAARITQHTARETQPDR